MQGRRLMSTIPCTSSKEPCTQAWFQQNPQTYPHSSCLHIMDKHYAFRTVQGMCTWWASTYMLCAPVNYILVSWYSCLCKDQWWPEPAHHQHQSLSPMQCSAKPHDHLFNLSTCRSQFARWPSWTMSAVYAPFSKASRKSCAVAYWEQSKGSPLHNPHPGRAMFFLSELNPLDAFFPICKS